MPKANLLNLSVENYESPEVAVSTPVFELVPTQDIIPIPSPVRQGEDLERLRVIADALDHVQDGLGSRIATIGAQVLGGGDGVGVEAFNPAAVGKAISNFVDVAIAYIKKFIAAVLEYGRRYVESRRYDRQSAIDVQKQVSKFVQQNRGYTTTITGPGANFLSYGLNQPAGPGELARAIKTFQTEVHTPYVDWFKANADVLKQVGGHLDKIFASSSLAKAPQESFDALAALTAAPAPRGWKSNSQGNRKTYFPMGSAWAGVEFRVASDNTTPLASLSANDVVQLDPVMSDTSVTLSGDLVNEYAKLAVGLVDMQIALAGPYDVVQTISKEIFDNYNRKFVDNGGELDDQTLQQMIGQRNSQLNDIMGYVSYVMTSIAGYMAYLNATRRAIGDMCVEVTTKK